MKQKTILNIAGATLLLVMLAGPLTAGRQNSYISPESTAGGDTAFTQWQFLLETPALFDMYYKLVRCNGQHVLELKLLNENPMEQTVSFDVVVKGLDNKVIVQKSYEVTYPGGQMKEANCSEGKEPGLMFVIPGKQGPAGLKIEAILKNQTK